MQVLKVWYAMVHSCQVDSLRRGRHSCLHSSATPLPPLLPSLFPLLFPPSPFHSLLPPPLVSVYVYCDQLLTLERVSTGMGGKLPEYLCGMSTPLQLSEDYQEFARFILRGIQYGFRIGFNGFKPKFCMSNMLSTREYPQVVAHYHQEGKKNRIIPVGDVARAAELGIHCSPFGVIPKKHKPNKWRLMA